MEKKEIFNTMDKTQRATLVGPAKYWDMKRKFQISFLKQVGLKPQHSFMDMGCGVLRGGIPIIDYLNTENYYGFDVREHVLNEGKKELSESGLEYKNPHLLSAPTIKEIDIETQFDFMLAFSVLIHMEDEIVIECLEFAKKYLKHDGKFYANVSIGNLQKNEWQGFPVIRRPIEIYKEFAQRIDLHMESIGVLEDFGHHSRNPAQDLHQILQFTKG